MNNLIQMLIKQKFQNIPSQMMSQLENQLKRTNPKAFQEFQKARQNNVDPNEYLSKVTGNFNKQQKEQWDSMMSSLRG